MMKPLTSTIKSTSAPALLFIHLLHLSLNLLIGLAQEPQARPSPAPLPSASHLSIDGLTLVVVFDKPVNLSAAVETIERRRVFEWGEQSVRIRDSGGNQVAGTGETSDTITYESSNTELRAQQLCQAPKVKQQGEARTVGASSQHLIQGIQLCAKLLTKKSLRLLHKYRVHNCLWPSRVQFLVQLGKPALTGGPIKIAFQRGALSEHNQPDGQVNERELPVELNRLPLESLGVPLVPRVALTGPNQVAPCGHFSLTAHLSSPFGTQPGEQVRLNWSVERVGFSGVMPPSPVAGASQPPAPVPVSGINTSAQAIAENQQQWELRWQTLQTLVSGNRANHLVLDSQLLQFAPQLYEFKLSATFTTSLSSVTVNASHQLNRLDFDAPTGTIYGSHLLAGQPQHNPSQELVLLADVQVPECASNIKQVGLYWQVSDSRVKFEQTYAPYYLAHSNSLPEQALIEFRVNLFYGIRVKKFSSTGSLIATGEAALDAQISNGLLIASVGQDSPENNNQLELLAINQPKDSDRYSYLWSCFDGKTAQPCQRNPKTLPAAVVANNSTRYELQPVAESATTLVDRDHLRQPALRLPLTWLQPDAQLWFGLQRFDRQTSSAASVTEYALVSLQPDATPMMSVGPVLVGSARRRATLRNPLTGALLLVEGARAVVVGRLSGDARQVRSFAWHSSNQVQPLHWTSREEIDQVTGKTELITELHLNPNLLVAHAHLELQLVACSGAGVAKASLHLDVVPGVRQCRVEASAVSSTPPALLISANHCNIPLGLSPLTYQLYAADTTGIDGFPANSADPTLTAAAAAEDDYTNEADEAHLYLLSQPLSAPQLSPVFALNGASARAMLAAQGGSGSPNNASSAAQTRLRFGTRVCDRLQSCRMFYSAALGPKQLLGPGAAAADLLQPAGATQEQMAAAGREQARSALVSLQSMVEGARRVNLAGNSVAAMGVLSGVIEAAERLVPSAGGAPLEDRARELLQVAMRDCLQYGAHSLQRQFHYSEPGQISLVTHVLSRVLQSTQSNLEFKFKALKLMAQLTRRSINEQLNLKLNCLADYKSLQLGYESLLSTFSHYSLDPNTDSSTAANNKQQIIKSNNNNTNQPTNSSSLPSSTTLWRHFSPSSSSSSTSSNSQLSSAATSVSRKKREEAILAYLKSIRLAYRALLSSAAIQLPLGDSQQFQYSREGNNGADLDRLSTARSHSLRKLSSSSSSNTLTASASTVGEISQPSKQQRLQQQQQLAAQSTSASLSSDIVSSLVHLTELSNTIDVDLHEFGSISVKLDQESVAKLKARLSNRKLHCRNVSTTAVSDTICSSFVLAVTSFAGKAPFRSLDLTQSLRVPVLELSLLSPLDGSNLAELMSPSEADEFKTTVAFTLPKTHLLDALDTAESSHRRRYKCYQFNEEANEWHKSSLGELQEVEEPVENEERKLIRCSFSGLGVYGAFLGKPPTSEASMSSPVVLAVMAVISLALLFAIYACFAANSTSGQQSRKGSDAKMEDIDDEQTLNEHDKTHRHPEQSHRNEFGYPLPL